MVNITELATVIRSKNAGAFVETFDLFFPDKESYLRVKRSGVINEKKISELYKRPVEDVTGIYYVDLCNAIKVSMIKRPGMSTGDRWQRDNHSANQHIPLLTIDIP